MAKDRMAFIGGGVMAEAMIRAVLDKHLVPPSSIAVTGPRPERRAELAKQFGIAAHASNGDAAKAADVVVLSVKPQVLPTVMKELRGKMRPDQLVISIVAGANMRALEVGLEHPTIVRAMPNTPAQVGMGVTAWYPSHAVTPEQREHAKSIVAALGEELMVEDESYLDMATALSGSGPAYVFLFTEALIDAGVHMGFPRRIAEQLVLQTIKGSASFYDQAGRHPATLRNQVTSPGGTSAEALYYLEKAGFRTAISRAVWAAYQRSLELGKEKPGHIDTHEDEEK